MGDWCFENSTSENYQWPSNWSQAIGYEYYSTYITYLFYKTLSSKLSVLEIFHTLVCSMDSYATILSYHIFLLTLLIYKNWDLIFNYSYRCYDKAGWNPMQNVGVLLWTFQSHIVLCSEKNIIIGRSLRDLTGKYFPITSIFITEFGWNRINTSSEFFRYR